MNILFAWELGANFGHLARQLPIARELRAHGHSVQFAVNDTMVARSLLSPHGFRFVQAPYNIKQPRLRMPPANYAEILLAEGFHDSRELLWRVDAWRNLFDLVQADVLLIDHAPTALLAGRLAGLPRVALSNGFELPPDLNPYPTFRPWESPSATRLAKSQQYALDHINAVCHACRHTPLQRLHEIFDGAVKALVTLPELDHYGARAGERYLGPIHAQLGGAKANWPAGEGKRILAYLRSDVPGFNALIKTLKARTNPILLVAPNASRKWVEQIADRRFAVYPGPIQVEPLLAECELGISYGGSGTLSQFALAGVPQLVLPKNVEQYLGAVRVAQLGAAIVIEQARREEDLASALDQVLNEEHFQHASREFAKKYFRFSPKQAVAGVVRMVEQSQPESVMSLTQLFNRLTLTNSYQLPAPSSK